MKKFAITSLLICTQLAFSQGFLKADGQKIVNEKGENVALKGLGLGGWMLQEGYMLKTADFAGPQYKIKEKIAELIGEDGKNEFYKAYHKNGITKADIDSLAKWEFNSIRLPMHYNLYTLPIEKEPVKGENTWLEEGFKMTDDLLKWCAANKIYLILDLHAVPGGQGKDANISDYDPSKPSVWESEENQKKTVALWKKLAERYKNEPWIGGYDIINEPNWAFTGSNPNGIDETSNAPLRKLSIEITKAIREVDQKHMVIIEGNGWGNNYNGMFPLWDDNMVLSFHKYWTYNNQGAIQQILDFRKQYNVPVWLGETGENSNVWFTEIIELLDKNNIGWAFWPMKKIDNIAGVTNVKITPEYQKLLDYWAKGGEKPSYDFSKKALMKIADNYKLQNVEVKKDVIDAMFRQINNNTTKPFKKHQLPGKIYAYEYDLGKIKEAYSDKDFQNLWVSDPNKRSEWNEGNQLRNDGVDIYKDNNQYYVGKTEAGEWLQFTVNNKIAKNYTVTLKYANPNKTSKVKLVTASGEELGTIDLPTTGNYTKWQTAITKNIKLKKGENKIRIIFEDGGVNLEYFEIK